MSQSRSNKALTLALYLNAALLGGILLVLLGRGSMPTTLSAAFAQNQLPIGGGAGVFIVPAQFSTNTFGCYIMDVDTQTICAYQYLPADRQLRLVAARTYRNDRRLQQFNSANPSPDEVLDLLEQQQQAARGNEQHKQKVSPEPPAKE
jgi:hypothetical protein